MFDDLGAAVRRRRWRQEELLTACRPACLLPPRPQNKAYPRNWLIRGRIRVQLKNEDGSLVNPEIPSREWVVGQYC